MEVFIESIQGILHESGLMNMTWQQGVMILISFVLMFLAIKKQYEPLLLLPIAFGMFLTNLPMAELYNQEFWITGDNPINYAQVLNKGNLLDILYIGVKACLLYTSWKKP